MKVLYAVKRGAPDWAEQIITERADIIEKAARTWGRQNGFDRFRVAEFADVPEKPDFVGAINTRA